MLWILKKKVIVFFQITHDGVHVPLIRQELKCRGCHGELEDHLQQTNNKNRKKLKKVKARFNLDQFQLIWNPSKSEYVGLNSFTIFYI